MKRSSAEGTRKERRSIIICEGSERASGQAARETSQPWPIAGAWYPDDADGLSLAILSCLVQVEQSVNSPFQSGFARSVHMK